MKNLTRSERQLGWGIGLFCHWFFVEGPGARRTRTR